MKTIVIGGGILGLAVANELSQRGVETVLVFDENDYTISATLAAGAMLGAFSEVTHDRQSEADKAETEFRVKSNRLYQDFVDNLVEITGSSLSIQRGTYMVANSAGKDDVKNINCIYDTAKFFREPVEWVDCDDIPGYRPHRHYIAHKSLFLSKEGFIDSELLLNTMLALLKASQFVTIVNQRVDSILSSDSKVSGIKLENGQRINSDSIALCAGAGTASILDKSHLSELGLPLIKGGKGSSLIVKTDFNVPNVIRTPNRDFACGTHIVSRGNGEVYIGATNRISDNPGGSMRATGGELHDLLHRSMHEINTGFRSSDIIGMRAGTRPLTIDNYPLIGETMLDGLHVATGTYRNGILMAPLIGKIVADNITREEDKNINHFSPSNRKHLISKPSVDFIIEKGVRDLVSFIQGPHGNLPYNRAQEMELFLTLLLKSSLTDNSVVKEPINSARRYLKNNLQTESILTIYYQLQNYSENADI